MLLPGLADDAIPVGSFLSLKTWVDLRSGLDSPESLQRLVAGAQGAAIDAAAAEKLLAGISPYRGLLPFREQDAGLFFGRKRFVDELANKVRQRTATNVVAVVGRSGSGKSSIVYAGLMPALRRERGVGGGSVWQILDLRPHDEPLHQLAAAFDPPKAEPGSLKYRAALNEGAKLLRERNVTLAELVRDRLRQESGSTRLLLYVDQWEELYTQATPREIKTDVDRARAADAKLFIDLVLDAAASSPCTLVLSVRSDFYPDLQTHDGLRVAVQESQVSLGTMNEAELRDVIEGPSKALGASVDPELTKKLIRDIGLDPASGRSDEYDIGKLPLLEYALEQAWAKRTGAEIGLPQYSGLEQALEERANALYGRLSAEEQAAAKRLFVSLVTPGEGREDTRARIDMPSDDLMRRVIQTFAGGEARLVVTDEAGGRRSVEVSHEALIRHWERLRTWIDENRDKLRAREFLKANRAEWLKHSRDPGLLDMPSLYVEAARSLYRQPGDVVIDDVKDYVEALLGHQRRRHKAEEAKQREELEAAQRLAEERAKSEEKERGLREKAEGSAKRATQPLPIDAVLGALRAALASNARAVLVAPPGAGKTTRAPLALIDHSWAADKRLLLLEPRRLAARAAAARMAATLGERVGETIGLRVRLQSLVSARTRIEVVTEGVFTRMILDDPSLEGVAAVLFDEFHERSLDADLGLALALDAQAALRQDLRLLVMSATLDGARVGALLGDAPLVESAGRAFPVATRYVGRNQGARIEDEVAGVALEALASETGSMLVFLPGQGETRRVAKILKARIRRPDVDIALLYGAMDAPAQDLAVAPAPPGRRKIVLATSIAETSLTIEGVRVVVDCGLMRVPRYEPGVGLTRTRDGARLARQRRPAARPRRARRAGRLHPPVGGGGDRRPHALRRAGNPVGRPFRTAARLRRLGRGRSCASRLPRFAAAGRARGGPRPSHLDRRDRRRRPHHRRGPRDLPPRAAAAPRAHGGRRGARGRSANGVRGSRRSDRARAWRRRRRSDDPARGLPPRPLAGANEARRLARGLAQRAGEALTPAFSRERERGRIPSPARGRKWREAPDEGASHTHPGALLASAYPERIAIARGKRGEFLMANGRAASLEPQDALAGEPFIAIAEISGRAAAARILLAAPLTLDDIVTVAGASIETAEELALDRPSASLRARRRRRLGALVLAEQTLAVPPDEQSALALARGALSLGAARLPWSKALRQWRDRIMFLRRAEGEPWPNLSDERLAKDPGWLAPFLLGKTRLDEIGADEFFEALRAMLPWELSRRLDDEAPTHFVAPTGTAAPIDYEAEGGPAIALRVQELFGLAEHPSVAGGRIPLTLHLLSPAHRPIQITRDLPGFWRGSWAAVRSDLRGRYPRHFWPEDPASAAPTTRAKPRGA